MVYTTLVFYQNSTIMAGHEISKQHIAFKQNATGNRDFNIKVVLVYTEFSTKEKKNKRTKKTKQKNKKKQYIFLK